MSSVTRAPALRRIFTSPALIPTILNGSILESIQVTMAKPFAARPVKPLDL